MKLLLDTHVLIWFLREPHELPPKVLAAIEEAGENAVVSMVSLWEIAIKTSLNKLRIPRPFQELFPHGVTESGMSLLGIEPRHLNALSTMPWHHRDPFDRMLIAQAQVDGFTLVSCDGFFPAYGIPLLW